MSPSKRLSSCLFWDQDKNILLESHLTTEVGADRSYIPSPLPDFFGLHYKEFQRDNFAQCGVSWQGVLLKHRALTALKVIKVLWDCVCDSPAGRDVLQTHTGTLQLGCGHRGEKGVEAEEVSRYNRTNSLTDCHCLHLYSKDHHSYLLSKYSLFYQCKYFNINKTNN